MKTLFLLPILLLSLISCSSETDSVVERDGLYYKKFSDTPFTGKFIKYRENGELDLKGNYQNGKKEGEWVSCHENGQLWGKGRFKNGELEGAWIGYHENGQLWNKGSYKDGEEEGEWVSYNEDGTVDEEWTGTFKNGKKISN